MMRSVLNSPALDFIQRLRDMIGKFREHGRNLPQMRESAKL